MSSILLFWQILLITTTITTCYAAGNSSCTIEVYECVHISKCTLEDFTDFLYPCNSGNQEGFVCCPLEAPIDIYTRKKSLFPENCGIFITSDRIISGRTAEIGQFPWMALLGYQQSNVDFTQFLCGGSLINERYVLTAAHCLSLHPGLELAVVRLGELDLLKEIDCTTGENKNICADPYVDILVQKTIRHNEFNDVTFKNDIALIRLAKPARFTDYVRPICLPFDEDFNRLTGRKLTVSGWGKTRASNAVGSTTLQFATVQVWNQTECNQYAPPSVRPILETQVCANGETTEDACSGDSGGPLANLTAKNNEIRYIQLGVVSFASTTTCGNAKLPTVYTRVDQFLPWILDNVY